MNVMLRTDRLAKKFGHVEALESLPIRNLIWLAWKLPPEPLWEFRSGWIPSSTGPIRDRRFLLRGRSRLD